MSEIFRVRNSLTMWVWIPLRLRVKHYDKRFQREMRREFSSVCDQDDIWIGSEVYSRLLIRYFFQQRVFRPDTSVPVYGAIITVKSGWHTCLETSAFIDNFKQFGYKTVYTPPPESMLFADVDRLEGLKHNNDLGERWGYTGARERYVNYTKKGTFDGSASTLLSLIVGPMLSIKVN